MGPKIYLFHDPRAPPDMTGLLGSFVQLTCAKEVMMFAVKNNRVIAKDVKADFMIHPLS
jgi:hypothetical protein